MHADEGVRTEDGSDLSGRRTVAEGALISQLRYNAC
jgi:hypothetical protein